MNPFIKIILSISIFALTSPPLDAQADLSDRQAIIKVIEDFYIGDHTGSIEHKQRSMDKKGAYRYVNNEGEYAEYIFPINSDDTDTSFTEELQSIEIYEQVALARIRQQNIENDGVHYKIMLLHKVKDKWIITTISWGSEITQ